MQDALRAHCEHNARADVTEPLASEIASRGVEFLYYQFVSINGRVLSKVVPASHLRRSLERGVQFHGSAISDLTSDRHGNLLGGGAVAEEFTAIPDPDSFQVLPWEPTVGRFLCRLYRRDDAARDAGKPLPTDVRGLLARAHAAFEERTGYELRSGCEPEMTWLGDSIDVLSRPGVSPAYHAGSLETLRPVYQRVIRYAQAMGLEMIEGDYEDSGQLELNFLYDRAERTADRLITYRQICIQVAKELGVTATFMPKPFAGVMGNGCHHNLSLWRDGVNAFQEAGRRDLHVSEISRRALGGLLTHAAPSMAVYASTVNSYKRYWDVGMFAPTHVDWGLDNRTCTVRVSANGRLEFKLPDAIVNPYLSHTLILASIEDGLVRDLDPGDPLVTSSYEREAGDRFAPLPLTLGDALHLFEASGLVRGALGDELTDLYTTYKRDEWARACGAITEWDREMYLHWVP